MFQLYQTNCLCMEFTTLSLKFMVRSNKVPLLQKRLLGYVIKVKPHLFKTYLKKRGLYCSLHMIAKYGTLGLNTSRLCRIELSIEESKFKVETPYESLLIWGRQKTFEVCGKKMKMSPLLREDHPLTLQVLLDSNLPFLNFIDFKIKITWMCFLDTTMTYCSWVHLVRSTSQLKTVIGNGLKEQISI